MGLIIEFTPGTVAAAAVVFPVLGILLVSLRIRTRIHRVKRLGIEDWLVIPAVLFATGMGLATLIGIAKKTVSYNTPAQKGAYQTYTQETVSEIFWFVEWMQPLALGCIKLSFIFFYRRIFNVGKHASSFNILSYAALGLMVVWMLGLFLAVVLICPGHPDAYWGPSAGRAEYCWTTTKFLYALSWSDVGTDLIIILMPIPPIMKLHVTPRKKFAFFAIFGLGALTVAASITRAVFYVRLLNAETTVLRTLDPNMLNTNGIYWMLIETGLALIAVNLPPLYGTVSREGIESAIRSVRSFASIGSQGSQSGKSKASSAIKTTGESLHSGTSIELVPRHLQNMSDSKATHTESLDNVDVEAGNINVTKSYTIQHP
ncbi:hypothetical protein G7Y89_g7365 [Cudoniella acicularis]|uniref:Rhodopsin domain-containing protein n=1 Tax=Cudoniella acicularis TaxID=354080 RepID=A0A8H4RL33_9HELO|nr:hypothetical protein G7Y89_g7365 [Cudoniella acicularis]